MLDAIIIGAGAAGLAAAGLLSRAGRSVAILEARDRIGGRILSIRDGAFGVPVELGAEFVHGRPDATWRLIREAGLVAYDLPFDHFQRRRGRLVHLDDFDDLIGPVMKGLSRLGRKDVSFAEYLNTHAREPRLADARRMATAFVQGFDAADPGLISAKSLAEEQEGLGDFDEQTQFRLLNGYGSLIEHMRGGLAGVKIHLRTVVHEVRWRRGRVECRAGGRVFRARRVIVTLPIGVLKAAAGSVGAVRFDPPVPQLASALEGLASGPVVKVVLRFKTPFWEDPRVIKAAKAGHKLRDACFLHDPAAAFPTFWTSRPLHVPILTAWAGGPKAVALTGLRQKELVRAALESLAALFNLQSSNLESSFLRANLAEAWSHDWPGGPFSRGAYSYVMVGGAAARGMLAKPVQATIYFAGEAADTSGQASTVAGALTSGERAARAILAQKRTPPA